MEEEKVICNQVHVCNKKKCLHIVPHVENEFCSKFWCGGVTCQAYCIGISQLKDGINN